MCEQTEIKYMDGEVVWVKLGSCWWPGQVTGYENLPEDIQTEFRKKQLIAAVKFFQEETFEFVRNLKQIYKYNCTQKDEFIRKGLDKFRSKTKDGSNYMGKFPGDVEMAEKLTDGNPNILKSEKFSPEEKPDIASLFGEKKLPKKKKDKDGGNNRRSSGNVLGNESDRKITHPRFLRNESDHEVRIRQQSTGSLPTTPNFNKDSQLYSCPLCNFTSTRVNVIICHNKSHRNGGWQSHVSPSRSYSSQLQQARGRMSLGNLPIESATPKRKYVRKNKSLTSKTTCDRSINESIKRKHTKQIEKITKKKKSDPELREKLLADWDDESDDDFELNRSTNTNENCSLSGKDTLGDSDGFTDDKDSNAKVKTEQKKRNKNNRKGADFDYHRDDEDDEDADVDDENERDLHRDHRHDHDDDDRGGGDGGGGGENGSDGGDGKDLIDASEKLLRETEPPKFLDKSIIEKTPVRKSKHKKFSDVSSSDEQNNSTLMTKGKLSSLKKLKSSDDDKEIVRPGESDDKKSKFSCFDFNEEELEPAIIPPVRKIPRVFGEKNTSLKKEIIKEFAMSQALQNERVNDENLLKNNKSQVNEEKINTNQSIDNDNDEKLMKEVNETVNAASDLVARIASETKSSTFDESKCDVTETELEIVEILQVEREKDDEELSNNDAGPLREPETISNESSSDLIAKRTETPNKTKEITETTKIHQTKSQELKRSITEDSDRVTIEEEDDTLPMSQLSRTTSGNSDITDVDGSLTEMGWSQLSEIIGGNTNTSATSTGSSTGIITSTSLSIDTDNTADEMSEVGKPTPKRRGRPRKSLSTFGGNENSEVKHATVMNKSDENHPSTTNNQEQNQKVSVDKDLSHSGRRRIPNKKYLHESGIYACSPGRRTPRTDDSQSETEENRPQYEQKGRRSTKSSTIDRNVPKSADERDFSDQTMDSAEESTSRSTPLPISPTKSTVETVKVDASPIGSTDNDDTTKDKDEHVEFNERVEMGDESLKSNNSRQVIDDSKNVSSVETKMDMLPPKKSQIKKFELSQADCDERKLTAVDETVTQMVVDNKFNNDIVDTTLESEVGSVVLPVESTNDATNLKDGISIAPDAIIVQEIVESEVIEKEDNIIELSKDSHPSEDETEVQTDSQVNDENKNAKFSSAIGTAIEQIDTRQKSTVKTISELANDYEDVVEPTATSTESVGDVRVGSPKLSTVEENNDISHDCTHDSSIQHVERSQLTIETTDDAPTEEQIVDKTVNEESNIVSTVTNVIGIISDTQQSSLSTSSLSEVSVPVKKREKPRIIENVQLKEPMQILKSKLLEKPPTKIGKHKLEQDLVKKLSPGVPRSKIMKIDTTVRKVMKAAPMSLSQKLQILKNEGATEIEDEKVSANSSALTDDSSTNITTSATTQISTSIAVSTGENFIQQTSMLEDMEIDINSIPFVLSEDLNPDSIEQMPVMISTVVPSSSNIPTALALPTATTKNDKKINQQLTHQLIPTQSETVNVSTSPTKRKISSPAILKNKAKAKPTITSIRTLNPPLTGGVKGLKFQNTPTGKATTLPISHKSGTPGKYVIVQTAGGQQVRYTVQGKTGLQQKFAIPVGKTAGNPQIVHQGNKVVILTSPTSGQTKMVPLSIQKTVGGNIQKIITSKDPAYSQISSSNVSPSKITTKSDNNSPTTSKLSAGQRIINQSNVVASKGMISTLGGQKLLGTLTPGLIKSNFTPLSNTSVAGKTLIGGKTLISTKGTILSQLSSGQTGNKTILAPIPSSTLTGKTLITSQGLVPSKGTVLTPITGQQVKAIAAKNPAKNSKIQYQQVQQKVQLPISQKSPKIAVSSTTLPIRVGGTLKSPSGAGTLVFQNVSQSPPNQTQQRTPTGKKIVRQHTITSTRSPQTPTTTQKLQQTVVSSPSTIIQRSKSSPILTAQKTPVQRNVRTLKSQQKIVVQKMRDNEQSTSVPTVSTSSVAVSSVTTKITQQKSMTPSTTSRNKNQTIKNQPKPVTSRALPQTTVATADVAVSVASSIDTVGILQQAQTNVEKPPEQVVNSIPSQEVPEKVQEEDGMKISTTQPQIMALPTESSDGTQTYVLVTIDGQGQIHPLDNNALMTLEGTTQNPDGTRTLYIDPSSFGESGNLDNIVLQFDNNSLSTLQSTTNDNSQQPTASTTVQSETFLNPNQDILAAALANTDFQQEIGLPEIPTTPVMPTTITQTSLINQTILQSTIIPTSDPISSPSVLETSLTLNQPIMTPLEVPSSVSMQSKTQSSATSTSQTVLELPMTIQNPNIPFITCTDDTTTPVNIAGNSMPDIGEMIESSSDEIRQTDTQIVPTTTQYLVLPTLDGNIEIQQQQNDAETSATASYSVSIPKDIVIDGSQVQTTPSMPIIDDTYIENDKFTAISIPHDNMDTDNLNRPPTSEISLEKSQNIETTSQNESDCLSEVVKTISDEQISLDDGKTGIDDMPIIQDIKEHSEAPSNPDFTIDSLPTVPEDNSQSADTCKPSTSPSTIVDSCISSESSNMDVQSSIPEDKESTIHPNESVSIDNISEMEIDDSRVIQENCDRSFGTNDDNDNNNNNNNNNNDNDCDESEKVAESSQHNPIVIDMEMDSAKITTTMSGTTTPVMTTTASLVGTSQERPSQSFEQFEVSESPTQSVSMKSESSSEATHSLKYESMEVDEQINESITNDEPPSQSFEDVKTNEASQSYATINDNNTNAPTQSFNEVMSQSQDERLQSSSEEMIDDTSFPTQSYDIGKVENVSENLETDGELSQEGNIPSQSNDIANDDGGIGTSSTFSINNTGLNEDETASSSYVPETPETQERDQDQESAISTSSYEIPTCEEINIASSSIIPDTSVGTEHTQSVHGNGAPEIPTSSYNLNPDSSSSTHHTDAVPTSSYEDAAVVEQNVSTSYEVPISMPGLEENLSQNFVSESTDHTNQPSSYYAQHVEDVTSEASQSYFIPGGPSTSCPSQNASPSYYEPPPTESEASPSFYSHDIEGTQQSSTASTTRNIDNIVEVASQSFYQETNDELKLGQQGEATPTYTERYPVDYTLENSPIDRHDLVESSVSATTQAAERHEKINEGWKTARRKLSTRENEDDLNIIRVINA